MDVTQTPANSVKGNPSNQTAGGKRKGENIFNVAYGLPASNITGDETDAPEPPISPKRQRHEDPLSKLATSANERRMRVREIITGLNSSSDEHSNSVHPLPGAVDKLSDPTFEGTLAFPFVGFRPSLRFKVADGNWPYMGRTKFKELVQELKKVRESDGYTTVRLHGTQGYGKSHLLATLVCYLAAQDERVVYIPDCRALVKNPVGYLRSAMLFAWADDITTQKKIMTLTTEKEIEDFLQSQENVLFVIDQMNALKRSMTNMQQWLDRLTSCHIAVLSSSANHTDYLEQSHKENQESVLYVYGGLNPVSHRKIMFQ